MWLYTVREVVVHSEGDGCTQWERWLYTVSEVVVNGGRGGCTQ